MLQAATGFGFSLLAAPLLFAAIEPEPAVVLLLVLGLEVNLLTLGTERRRPRPLRRSTVLMLAFAVAGRAGRRRGAARAARGGAADRGDARRGGHARRAPGDERARSRLARRARRRRADDLDVDQRPADAPAPARPRRDARAGARHAHGRASSGWPASARPRCSPPATRSCPTATLTARARPRRARRPPRRPARLRATGGGRSLRAGLDRGADRRRRGRPHRRAPLNPLGFRRNGAVARGPAFSRRRLVPGAGAGEQPHARRGGADLRGSGAGVRRLPQPHPVAAAPRAALPAQARVPAAGDGPADLGRRPRASTSSTTCATRRCRSPGPRSSCARWPRGSTRSGWTAPSRCGRRGSCRASSAAASR